VDNPQGIPARPFPHCAARRTQRINLQKLLERIAGRIARALERKGLTFFAVCADWPGSFRSRSREQARLNRALFLPLSGGRNQKQRMQIGSL
jgi:hypothetical protein